MMTTARDHLSRSDAVTVARIEAAVPDLAAACALTGRFANMLRNGEHDNLEEWLSEAGGSLLASLARGLNADKDAALAALREPWPNGQTEGQINKLKALKRQMYGRANLDLLRARRPRLALPGIRRDRRPPTDRRTGSGRFSRPDRPRP